MGIEDRDWYQESYRSKERKANGSCYQNTFGWYYKLRGQTFGPCDKDNILCLIREHTLDEHTLVKHEGLLDWTPVGTLSYEFPLHKPRRNRNGNFNNCTALLDMKRNRDVGYDTKDWLWIIYLWTPLYLIQRSRKTDHKKDM